MAELRIVIGEQPTPGNTQLFLVDDEGTITRLSLVQKFEVSADVKNPLAGVYLQTLNPRSIPGFSDTEISVQEKQIQLLRDSGFAVDVMNIETTNPVTNETESEDQEWIDKALEAEKSGYVGTENTETLINEIAETKTKRKLKTKNDNA